MNCLECDTCIFEGPIEMAQIPYEIHITVEKGDVQEFSDACKQLGVKPIFLENQIKMGGTIKDMITSSKLMGNDAIAFKEMDRIYYGLIDAGYKIVRKKIETSPHHPEVPTRLNKLIIGRSQYFESHLAMKIDLQRYWKLNELVTKHNMFLSRNIFKRYPDNMVAVMATCRSYEGPYEKFDEETREKKTILFQNGFPTDKHVTEFALYDSNIQHDEAWIGEARERM